MNYMTAIKAKPKLILTRLYIIGDIGYEFLSTNHSWFGVYLQNFSSISNVYINLYIYYIDVMDRNPKSANIWEVPVVD